MLSHSATDQRQSLKPSSVHAELRRLTKPDHDKVDAAFNRFDLADRRQYGAFLSAHAKVLPGLERDLAPSNLIPDWTGRSNLLADDLRALGLPIPAVSPVAVRPGAAIWGAIYVIEGSRLGGAVLAKRIGAGLPNAFLSAVHEHGAWKRVLRAIEQAATGPEWLNAAVAGAKAVFAAYERAAQEERDNG